MSAEAVYQVTQALKARLQAALVAAGDNGTVFVGPLDDPAAGSASLILFLYRLTPNPSLRNVEHRVPAVAPNPPVVYRNPLPLDLYYLVTVGTRPGVSEEPRLRVLGYALRELQRDPDLVGALVAQQSIHVSLEPLSIEEVSRVWALFPTANYRTSVAYLASPVWIDPAVPEAQAAPVKQDQLQASSLAGSGRLQR